MGKTKTQLPGEWCFPPGGPYRSFTITDWGKWKRWLEQEFPAEMGSPDPTTTRPEPRSLNSVFEQLNDRAWLAARYETQGLTMQEIADELGCSMGAVQHAMKHHEIEGRRRGPRRAKEAEPNATWSERAKKL